MSEVFGSEERCQKRVSFSEFVGGPCGRRAKGRTEDGRLACGIHLAAERKRRERRAEDDLHRTKSEEAHASATEAVGALASFGINATVYYKSGYSGPGRYTGEVVVDPEEVLRALEGAG